MAGAPSSVSRAVMCHTYGWFRHALVYARFSLGRWSLVVARVGLLVLFLVACVCFRPLFLRSLPGILFSICVIASTMESGALRLWVSKLW